MLTVLVALLIGCASPLVTATTSDAGTYEVSIPSDTWPEGDADVAFTLTAGGEPATGLSLVVHPTMSGMDHGEVEVETTEGDPGVYTGTVPFSMTGVWDLHGEIAPDADAFTLVVSVE